MIVNFLCNGVLVFQQQRAADGMLRAFDYLYHAVPGGVVEIYRCLAVRWHYGGQGDYVDVILTRAADETST